MTNRIPWARALTEGVAIIVSILLAFAIQAWWEDLGQRRAEQAYLLQLRADLGRAVAQLTEAAEREEAVVQSVTMVIAASRQPEPPPNDSLVVWLGAIGNYNSGVPTLTTAQGLLGSDALRTIRSQEVRDGLIGLLDQLRQMEQGQLRHEELFMQGLFRLNRVVPALSRGRPRYVGLVGPGPDSLTRDTRVEPGDPMDLRPYLHDPAFLAAVDELWISHENIRSYVQGMLNESRRFLALLDRTIDPS